MPVPCLSRPDQQCAYFPGLSCTSASASQHQPAQAQPPDMNDPCRDQSYISSASASLYLVSPFTTVYGLLPGRQQKEERMRRRSRRCGVSAANWSATKPRIPLGHIQYKKKKVPSRDLPDLTRAKAGRPPTRTHANSHFIATPGHQSLLLPCIHGNALPSSLQPGPLPSPRATIQRQLCYAPSNRGRPWRLLPWASTLDRGPWLIGASHDAPLSPNHRHRQPLCTLAFFLPFPTRSQRWSPQRPMIT